LLGNEHPSIIFQGFVEAVHIQLFYCWCRRMKCKGTERSYFRHQTQEKRFDAGRDSWFFIDVSPIFAVFRMRHVIDELAPGFIGVAVLYLISLHMPCHLGCSRYNRRNRMAIAAECQVNIEKDAR